MRQSASSVSHSSSPVKRLSAMMCAWSVTMNTRSPATADAAVGAAAGHARRARPLEVPDLPAAAGVERVALVGRGHVHDAVDDDRRALQLAGVRESVNIHCGASRATLVLSICVSVV